MADHSNDNKRIAKNTLIIYVNLFLNMAIGLVSSRLILQALGVSDFGLYNVAGGVAILFAFISSALASTTYRFVNVEMGKPDGDVNHVFNVCRVLHIALAIMLFLLIEVGGIWYLNRYINIESGKEEDAMFVFQIAAIMMGLGVMNVPYSSLFGANEKFLFSTIVSLAGKLIEFGLVIWLLGYGGNRVRAYAIIMMTSTIIPFIAYHLFSYLRWPDYVKWRLVRDWQCYKEVIVFSSYNFLSGAAGMARSHGCSLLLNYFFGTTVNGAFAIAKSVERHASSFSNRFQGAAGPQVTQSYSSGEYERVYYLTSRIAKYSMLIMLLAFFPLWAEMDFVLHIWLADVPEGTLMFCRLTLLTLYVSVTDGGISQVVDASGKVARFRTWYSVLTLSCIPIGYFVLKAGASPYMLLVLFIVADVIWRIIQFWMAYRILDFPVTQFCRDAYLPIASVSVLMIICLFITSHIPLDSTLWHVGRMFFILLLTLASVFVIGLKKSEQIKFLYYIKKRFLK